MTMTRLGLGPGGLDTAGGHTIRLNDGATFLCRSDERLLAAMERTFARPIPVGCRRGGCGVCRVRILEGRYTTAPMSAAYVNSAEREKGYALSCCVFPASDLVVELAPKPKAAALPAVADLIPQET